MAQLAATAAILMRLKHCCFVLDGTEQPHLTWVPKHHTIGTALALQLAAAATTGISVVRCSRAHLCSAYGLMHHDACIRQAGPHALLTSSEQQ